MADTQDVAKALFKIVTGENYGGEYQYLDDLSPKTLVSFFEYLANRYYIGIEDIPSIRAQFGSDAWPI